MATIKEMSEQFVHNYTKGGTKQSWLEEGFIEGANAVLEEIKKIVESSDFIAFPRVTHEKLSNKIKQLKGE